MRNPYTEKKTWYCRQASCSLFTNFFGKKVTTNFSLSKLQTVETRDENWIEPTLTTLSRTDLYQP